MNYSGKLYGKVGKTYIPLVLTSEDVDKMERELAEANRHIARLNETLGNAAIAFDTCSDQRDRLAEVLDEVMSGYDVVSETASICAVYVATKVEPALAAVKGVNE